MKLFENCIGVVAVVFALIAATPGTASPLSEDEIQASLVGKTIQGKRMGMTMQIRLDADGSAAMRSTVMDDTGDWRINGQELCMKWQRFNNGQERCSLVSQEKDGYRLQGGPLMKVVPDS